jgi:O-antigen/teichoic acid export membrane protein
MTSIFKPALLLMSGRALGFAATFLIPVVLVRVFDQAEFGTYKQLFLIYFTLFSIAQFGMAESLYYFLPMAPQAAGRYAMNALILLAVAGLACLGLLISIASPIAGWMNNGELPKYIPLLGLHLLLMLASEVLERVMISDRQYLLASCSYGFFDLLRAGLFIIPVLLMPGLYWLLVGAVTFAALRLCAALIYLWREFGSDFRPDLALLKQQLTYALPFGMYVLIHMAQENFHQYVVSYHVDAATFAIYAVGCLQIPLIDFLAGPACNVMMVRMSEEIRDGNSQAVLAMWHDTTRKLALVFFPLVGLLLVCARELIVLLFTDAYLASVPIFMIWSTAIVWSVWQTDGVLRVYAETRFLLFLNVIRLLLIAALIHWFMSAYQLVGAVLVTLLATAAGKGLALVRMKRRLRVSLAQLVPWRALAAIAGAAAVSGTAALMVKAVLPLSTFPLLASTSLVYAATYLILAFRISLLNGTERLALAGWVRSWTAQAVKPGICRS